MNDVIAVERGYRLRVAATYLWFNLEQAHWMAIRGALAGVGAETAQDGLEGEELCTVPGLMLSYHAAEQRLQAQVSEEGGAAAAAGLRILRETAPSPAAEASPTWLWAPEPFAVAGQRAEPADRLLRAARWRAPRDQSQSVMQAVGVALGVFDERATVQVEVQSECWVTVSTPLHVEDGDDRQRRASGFEALLSRLGAPVRCDHVTHA